MAPPSPLPSPSLLPPQTHPSISSLPPPPYPTPTPLPTTHPTDPTKIRSRNWVQTRAAHRILDPQTSSPPASQAHPTPMTLDPPTSSPLASSPMPPEKFLPRKFSQSLVKIRLSLSPNPIRILNNPKPPTRAPPKSQIHITAPNPYHLLHFDFVSKASICLLHRQRHYHHYRRYIPIPPQARQ